MKQPDIKLNLQPKLRYELTLAVQDAPGPFESVTGFMQYEVQNERDCAPADAISGHHQRLDFDPDVELKRLDDGKTHKGVIYLDFLRDEDYYGLGVCRWKMTGFTAVMKAGAVTFNAFISEQQIAGLQLKTEYFPKSYFNDRSVIENTHTAGIPSSELVTREPSKFFHTTLTAKEDFR